MMDFTAIAKAKQALDTFNANHPKFIPFLNAASQKAIKEGSIIEIAVTGPDGEKIETNLKVTRSDIELIEMLKNLKM